MSHTRLPHELQDRYPSPLQVLPALLPSGPSPTTAAGVVEAQALARLAGDVADSNVPYSKNAQSAAEYVPEIYNQLFREEVTFLPRPNYMESQHGINGKMRSILVDWLVEGHMKYRLRKERCTSRVLRA